MSPTDVHAEQTTVVTHDTPLDPTEIMQLATSYWSSAVLLGANEIGVFAALGEGAKTADEMVDRLHADTRGMTRLLDACCGLNLIVKQGDHYILPSVSAAFLVPGRPGYLGNALRWAHDQYAAWGGLAEAVRTGDPIIEPEQYLGDDPERTATFVMGMHDRALGVARGVVRYIDLEGCSTLLDVGGGPGTYAMLLAERYPALHATVLDLPAIVTAARDLIAKAGLSAQVDTVAADATFGDYGADRYDAILFSGILHRMTPVTIGRMLDGAYRALVTGGRVFVNDIMADATKTQPVFSALFSLQMLLTSREGAVFAAEECLQWLEAARFGDVHIQRLPSPLPYTVVSAHKT